MKRVHLCILILGAVMLACDLNLPQVAVATKPTVSIGSPPTGTEFRAGQDVLVQASGSDARGVARIELWVDNVLVATEKPAAPQLQFSAVLRWTSIPGARVLTVKAINADGVSSEPASIAVNVLMPITPTVPVPPTITATVTPPTATATPGTPTFSKITIAENVTDAGEIINPTNTFPAGTKKVAVYFTYLNMETGDAWGRKWFRDGALLIEKNETWDRGATGWRTADYVMTEGAALVSGTYDFVLYLGGKEVQRAAFVIGAMGSVPPPLPTPTIPLNACPPNPVYKHLANTLNATLTINMSGPRSYRIILPPGGIRDTCFVAGAYNVTMSASGYNDTTETKTWTPNTDKPDCWWFGNEISCNAPTDLRLYSPPDAAGAMLDPDAINILFTIQNGSPTGYVVDKQGNRFVPPGYLTIAGFHVNVGDRIVIQTDQPRFSMLFDCGTTSQTYSPCDFIAAMPSNLPAQIVKRARGTAYLNISRADNWAGQRPGFPLLRYPADPVLRIVIAD